MNNWYFPHSNQLSHTICVLNCMYPYISGLYDRPRASVLQGSILCHLQVTKGPWIPFIVFCCLCHSVLSYIIIFDFGNLQYLFTHCLFECFIVTECQVLLRCWRHSDSVSALLYLNQFKILSICSISFCPNCRAIPTYHICLTSTFGWA